MIQETSKPELHKQSATALSEDARMEANDTGPQEEPQSSPRKESEEPHHYRGTDTRHPRLSSRPYLNEMSSGSDQTGAVAALQATNRRLEDQVAQLLRDLESTRKGQRREMAEKEAVLVKMSRAFESARWQHREELEEKEAALSEMKMALESARREHREELTEKDAELAEMKQTLCMYDDCSEADIRTMVENINKRIRALALNVAKKWVKDAEGVGEGGRNHSQELSEHDVGMMRDIIGTELVDALQDTRPGKSQCAFDILQRAWQASIVKVVARILASFSARLAADQEGSMLDEALKKISEEVMKGEVQPAYGHWRFITHRHLNEGALSQAQAIRVYTGEALAYCWTAGRLILKDRCPNDQTLKNAFQVQLKEIMEESVKLLNSIQEKVVTTNYEPFRPLNGYIFHSEGMDVDKQDAHHPGDRVVCTTGLGLWCSQKKGRDNTDRLPQKHIFQKAQVLTEANLNDMVAT